MNPNRLLVIDDEPDICDFVKEVAEDNGYEVAVATEFEGFSASYESLAPTVIFLDLQMPEIDGVQLLRFLAEEKCQAKIAVISGADARVLSTAGRLGASQGLDILGTLQKPVTLDALERLLGQVTRLPPPVDESSLGEAIASGELAVFYQPKIRINKPDEIDSLEALIRWPVLGSSRSAPRGTPGLQPA